MVKRLLWWLSLILLVVLGLSYRHYLAFQEDAFAKWAMDSQLTQTPQGPVEFQRKGAGIPLLQFHGTPSSYRGNLNFPIYQSLFDQGFELISPSRPGYMRTPLSTGRTPAAQADAFSALVSQLGYDKVVVVGISGGGPSALAFAERHPDQCRALVLIEALALPIDAKAQDLSSYARLLTLVLDHNFLAWLVASPLFSHFLPEGPQQQMSEEFAEYLAMFPHFEAGMRNDAEQFKRLAPLPPQLTPCPTLILHGLDDQVVPFDNATAMLAQIPGAKLVPFKGAGHELFYSHAAQISQAVADFVKTPRAP